MHTSASGSLNVVNEASGIKLIAVIQEAEGGGYWAEVPFLDGCVSEGDTWNEARDNIAEAASGVVATMRERLASGTAPGFPSLPEGFSLDVPPDEREYASAVLHNFYQIWEDSFGDELRSICSEQKTAMYEEIIL